MKIIQIVTQMEAGGAQRVALLLGEELRNRGLEQEIWFFYTKRPVYQDNPNIHSFYPRGINFYQYLPLLIKLILRINLEKPEVIITHTRYANILGQLTATFLRIPLRIAVQHSPLNTHPRIAKLIDRILGSFGFFSKIICVSNTVIESTKNYPNAYKHRVQLIYNGLPEIQVFCSKKQTRLKWNLPENSSIIVTSGRLARVKNHSLLLETMKMLADTHLVVIGDGELKDELKELTSSLSINNKVIFVGEVNWNEAMALVKASDIFVFPSFHESMGMAMVEAMQLGLPVIASDIPALREVAGNAAIFIQPDEPEALARAVINIQNDPAMAKRMSRLSKESAANFSLQEMADAYEKLIKQILSG